MFEMIPITLGEGFFIYLMVGIGFILLLWVYYDFRDKQFYQWERSKTVFHCIKCGKIYADKMGGKQSRCPSCQFKNAPLQF